MNNSIKAAGLAIIASLGLGACVTDGGYGYSGVSVGYGSAGYYDRGYGYDDGYGYGGGYSSPYWGWYGDYYYPGSGYYVYDRYRHAHRWNDGQRRYWEQRRNSWHGDRPGDRPGTHQNWGGFDRNAQGRPQQYRPSQARPSQARPQQARPDRARPSQPNRGSARPSGYHGDHGHRRPH